MIRVVMLLLIVGGLAGFGTIAWMVMPASETAQAAVAAPVAKVSVMVAARPIRPGLLLKPEDMTFKEVPEDTLPLGAVPEAPDAKRAMIGGMVRRAMTPGDVIRLPTDVLRPADHGFLAAVLAPGSRAVSVAVDIVSGTAGLIWPGDRVDLILTQALEEPLAPGRRVVAETVLQDVRVLAIDQQLAQGITGNNGDAPPARTVTLEVSPAHAEYVHVATRLGRLSLVVRAAEQGTAPQNRTAVTYSGDVSAALVAQVPRPAPNTIKVQSGVSETKEYKF